MLDVLQQDARFAWRSLKRNPGLTALIVVTFTLGIGVNVVDAERLLQPLAVLDFVGVAGIRHGDETSRSHSERSEEAALYEAHRSFVAAQTAIHFAPSLQSWSDRDANRWGGVLDCKRAGVAKSS
jgi:hypothetical protein